VSGTPNDGSADTVAPCVHANSARVKASGAGNVFFDISDANFSVVRRPPVVAVSAVGGSVNNQCQFLVTFSASVTDDCGTEANAVTVDALPQQNNFTVGPVSFNAVQVDAAKVAVTGSVLVSNLTSSPAVLGIKVTGVDACGDKGSKTAQVQVADTTPPTITASVMPSILWPPNHSLRDIVANVSVQDNCPNVGFVLSSIVSNEPDNGVGDGNTVNDVQGAAFGTADTAFQLRAERSGVGDGRTYTVTYTATDGSQNQTLAQAVVTVPHSKKP